MGDTKGLHWWQGYDRVQVSNTRHILLKIRADLKKGIFQFQQRCHCHYKYFLFRWWLIRWFYEKVLCWRTMMRKILEFFSACCRSETDTLKQMNFNLKTFRSLIFFSFKKLVNFLINQYFSYLYNEPYFFSSICYHFLNEGKGFYRVNFPARKN